MTARKPRDGETLLWYDDDERQSYEAGRMSCCEPWRWPSALVKGRNRRENHCFPEIAARAHFEQLGYRVLLSSPKYPDDLGFLLFHYAGMRRKGHPAFARLQQHFPSVDLNELAERARRAKLRETGKGGGGDPDLFVFHPTSGERFFVEAKWRDSPRPNQLVCFKLIEKHLCPVRIVRLDSISGAR